MPPLTLSWSRQPNEKGINVYAIRRWLGPTALAAVKSRYRHQVQYQPEVSAVIESEASPSHQQRQQRTPKEAWHYRLVPRSIGASLLLVLTSATTLALEPAPLPADPSLAALIARSLEARPELARAEAQRQAQHARVPQAAALPDPTLQVGLQNDGFERMEIGSMEQSWVSFTAAQTFPWPGKRGLRGDIAASAAGQSDSVLQRLRLGTEADVRRAYLDLQLVRDRRELLDQLAVLWDKSFAIARTRYETGVGPQSDVLRAQLESNRLRQRHIALAAAERIQIQALNRLCQQALDTVVDTPTPIAALTPVREFSDRFDVERALRRSPELASAKLARKQARAALELARKSYFPDLTVGAGVMVRGDLPPMWLLSVGGPLPLYAESSQRHLVAGAAAAHTAARRTVETIEADVRQRNADRRAAFVAARDSIELYEGGMLVQSAATAESVLKQYEVGKVTFSAVLDSNAGVINDREGYLQTIAAAHRLLIAEEAVELSPATAPSAGTADASIPGAEAAATESGTASAADTNAAPNAGSAGMSGM